MNSWILLATLGVRITQMILGIVAEVKPEKADDITLGMNLLGDLVNALPKYIEIARKYKDKGLSLEDIVQMSKEQIDTVVDAQYPKK